MSNFKTKNLSKIDELDSLLNEGPVLVTGLPGSGKSYIAALSKTRNKVDLDKFSSAKGGKWITDLTLLEKALPAKGHALVFGISDNIVDVAKVVCKQYSDETIDLVVMLPSSRLHSKANLLKAEQLKADKPDEWKANFRRNAAIPAKDVEIRSLILQKDLVNALSKNLGQIYMFRNSPVSVDAVVKGWHEGAETQSVPVEVKESKLSKGKEDTNFKGHL